MGPSVLLKSLHADHWRGYVKIGALCEWSYVNSQSSLLKGCCVLLTQKSIGILLNLVVQVHEAVRHRARRKSSSADGNYRQLLPLSNKYIHCRDAVQDLNALNPNVGTNVGTLPRLPTKMETHAW